RFAPEKEGEMTTQEQIGRSRRAATCLVLAAALAAAAAVAATARRPAAASAAASAGGDQLWTALYNGPANSFDAATSIAVAPGGSRVFVTGSSAGANTAGDYATVAIDSANGSRLWSARFGTT